MRDAERIALIIGAGSSLGVPIAEKFAQQHLTTLVACHDASIVDRDVTALRERGCEAGGLTVDVTNEASCARAIEACLARGTLVAVVNCASVSGSSPLRDPQGPARWRRTLEVGLLGAMVLTSAVARHVPQTVPGVSLVHISSINAGIAVPGYGAYCAAKAGLEAFVSVAALELAPHHRVNAVAPGPLETQAQVFQDFPGFLENLKTRHPLGSRLTRPADIANAVAFLSSDAASFITGRTLVVDGGISLNFGSMPNTQELAERLLG